VGAQFNLPYIQVLVNNSYLGLIRQSQRGFNMDYCVQLAFDNINAPDTKGLGVDHVAVVQGLGCKAIRVLEPTDILPAFDQAKKWMKQYRVPVVVEIILGASRISPWEPRLTTSPSSGSGKGAAMLPPPSRCWTS
jgi:tartronate-semialdehyde synthase